MSEEGTIRERGGELVIWGDEDGEVWFAQGHVAGVTMSLGVVALEVECVGEGEAPGLHDLGEVEHFFARTEGADDETMIVCDEGDEGAEPYSRLSRK